MRERPLILRADEVRAVLANAKTQLRRPIKRGQVFRFCRDGEGPCDLDAAERRAINAEPFHWEQGNPAHPSMDQLLTLCPFGIPGDRRWVRETWAALSNEDGHTIDANGRLCREREAARIYRADAKPAPYGLERMPDGSDFGGPWRSSMMMPRWASRLTLEVVSVRVERAQGINAIDAIAEGCGIQVNDNREQFERSALVHFEREWDSIYANTPNAWAANPWVWAVAFKRGAAKDGGLSE